MGAATCRPATGARFLPLLILVLERAVDAGTSSAVAAWATEQELLAHLTAGGDLGVVPNRADEHELQQEEEKTETAEQLPLLRICIARSWWAAARELVSRAHLQNAARGNSKGGSSDSVTSISKEVRALLAGVKQNADSLGAFADETYRGQTRGLDEVPCALQWAQNSSSVFLGVKYAARWSAPGAIEVVDVVTNISETSFILEGFGHHSSIRKRYVVNLTLYADVVPTHSSWSAASVGRLTATLQKARVAKWPRLTRSKSRSRHQLTSWMDMEERWAAELARTTNVAKESAKKAKPSPTPAPPAPRKSTANTSAFNQALTSWRKLSLRQWKRLRKTARRRPGMFIAAASGFTIYVFVVLWCVRQCCCQRRLPPVKAAGLAAMARAEAAKPKEDPLLHGPPEAELAEPSSSPAVNGEELPTDQQPS